MTNRGLAVSGVPLSWLVCSEEAPVSKSGALRELLGSSQSSSCLPNLGWPQYFIPFPIRCLCMTCCLFVLTCSRYEASGSDQAVWPDRRADFSGALF